MLGNHGIDQSGAARWHPKALLQTRQGQGLAVLGLLQESEYQLKRGHPHRHVQGLDHQAGCTIAVTASQELLPEVPPVLIREEVALVAAMEQRPGLGAQAIDQVLKVNAPRPRAMAAIAIGTGKLADPVAAQIHDQPVMVQAHRDLEARKTMGSSILVV